MARPRFQPTVDQRRIVKTMAACGVRHEDIMRRVGLRSAKTLRRHFREELDRGQIDANAQVAQSLFKMAVSGNHPAAAIFWLKARASWRDQEPMIAHGSIPPFIVSPEGGAS